MCACMHVHVCVDMYLAYMLHLRILYIIICVYLHIVLELLLYGVYEEST